MEQPSVDPAAAKGPARLPYDAVCKAFFSKAVAVLDLLFGFVADGIPGGRDWFGRLDFSTLELAPTETIDDDFQRRHNDVIWRVRFRDAAGKADWLHVVIMLEFQASVDWFMALRMQRYAVRLYDRMWKGRQPTSRDRLPPILGVVLYTGKGSWKAATRLSDLVGPGTRPGGEAAAAPPLFAGESYFAVDLPRCAREGLVPENVVSLLARSVVMRDAREAAAIVTEAYRLLRGPERGELLDLFLAWFRLAAAWLKLNLEILEDSRRMARLDKTGELQPAMEEFFHPGFEALRAEAAAEANAKAAAERAARIAAEKAAEAAAEKAAKATAEATAKAIAREREGLQHLTQRKFGAETAERLGTLIATVDDPDRLRAVAEWIIDCTHGHDLLTHLQGSA